MNQVSKQFFARCPDCKRSFGIEPRFVLQYFRRVLDAHKHRLDLFEDVLLSAQEDVVKERESATRRGKGG